MMRIQDIREGLDGTADRIADRIGAQVADAGAALGAAVDDAVERLRNFLAAVLVGGVVLAAVAFSMLLAAVQGRA